MASKFITRYCKRCYQMNYYAIFRKEREKSEHALARLCACASKAKLLATNRRCQTLMGHPYKIYYVIYSSYIIENARKFRHRWIGNGFFNEMDKENAVLIFPEEIHASGQEIESEHFFFIHTHFTHHLSVSQSIETVYWKPIG